MVGNAEEGVVQLERAFELNPKDGRLFVLVTVLARAHLNAGHYEEAVSWGRRAVHFRTNAVEAHLGIRC